MQPKKITTPVILKLLIALIAGIIIAFYTSISIPLWSILYGVGALLFLMVPLISKYAFSSNMFGVVSTVVFFLLGVYKVGVHDTSNHPQYFNQSESTNSIYQLEILETPEEKESTVKCFANIRAVDNQKAVGTVLVYLEKDEHALQLKYGDLISFKGWFTPVRVNGNPHEFDYARYLKIHDVRHQAYVTSENWVKVGNDGNGVLTAVNSIRTFLDERLCESGLNEENLMVARALILGEKEFLDRETLRTFSSAGAMHVLAVSGLHVGIIMLVFSFLFKPIKQVKNGKLFFLILVVFSVWTYAFITGLSSSVLRASVMFSFVIIGKELERDTSIYQSIMVSAFLLILIEPLVLFQVGFQLSYLAVLGIVFLQPRIYNLLYTRYFLLDKVWQITSVSIAAQVATFPLGLYYFHQFPNFFLVSNLIVIPLAFAILIVGIVYFMVFWIPFVNHFIYTLLDLLITILNVGVKWIEGLPYSIYWGVSIYWFEVFLLYAIILLGVGAFINRKVNLLFAGLAGVVLLLTFNLIEKHRLEKSNEIVVYNVNKSVAIDVFYGRKNVFIASENLINDEDKLLFHVKHNWFYRTGSEKPYVAEVHNYNEPLLQVGERKVLLLNDSLMKSNYKYTIPKTEFVFANELSFVPESIIDDWVSRKVTIIVGDAVKSGLTRYLKRKLVDEQLFLLKEKGAFVYTF